MEDVDQVRLELQTLVPLHFGEDFIRRPRWTVRSEVRHGLDGIGQGDDTGQDRDFIAMQAVRAAPVGSFVMPPDRLGGLGQFGEEGRNHSPAGVGMKTENIAVLPHKRGGEHDERVGNGQHSDIVKLSRNRERIHGFRGEAERPTDQCGNVANSPLASCGVGKAQLQQRRQRPEVSFRTFSHICGFVAHDVLRRSDCPTAWSILAVCVVSPSMGGVFGEASPIIREAAKKPILL
ncbi:MAG: hypothetical protein AABZ12_09510 [Planctomycetota bacterium]